MRTRALLLIPVLALALAAGCSQKESAKAPPPEPLDSPRRTAEYLFSTLTGTENIHPSFLFSTRIPEELSAGYVEDFKKKKEVTKFNVARVDKRTDSATALVKYYYFEKFGKDGATKLGGKKLGAQTIELERRNGKWLVLRTGDAFDEKVEQQFFYDCLNVVMDAAINQELYFGEKHSYTAILADLNRINKLETNRCREFAIEDADKKDFAITAVTANRFPCRILVNSEAVIPKRYSECAPGEAIR